MTIIECEGIRTLTRTCNVLPNVITTVRRATSLVGLQDDISEWCRSPLDNSPRRLCSTQTEDKHIPFSTGKTLAQTKKEQRWWYDPTIKYEALRQCAVPRYAYYDVSATDWSDASASASDSEIETETMAGDKVQNQNEKILAGAKEEQLFHYDSDINYELPKELADLETYGAESDSQAEAETETETEIMTEVQTRREKILAGIKDDELFCYNPNIEYEPIKRYALPRFAFSDSSSTDWSASSESESEMEAKSMATGEARTQKDEIPDGTKEKQFFCDNLAKSPLSDLLISIHSWKLG